MLMGVECLVSYCSSRVALHRVSIFLLHPFPLALPLRRALARKLSQPCQAFDISPPDYFCHDFYRPVVAQDYRVFGHEIQRRIFSRVPRRPLCPRCRPVRTPKSGLRPYGKGRPLRRLRRPRLVQRDIVIIPRSFFLLPPLPLLRWLAFARRLDKLGRINLRWMRTEERLLCRWSVFVVRKHSRPIHCIVYPLLQQDIRPGFWRTQWCRSLGVL